MSPPIEQPKTPPGIRADLAAVETFAQGLASQVGGIGEDVRELRKQMDVHEGRNVERERDLRKEVQGVREDVADLRTEIDARLDKMEGALKVLVDRIPPTDPSVSPGPITTVFGIPPRKQSGSTGLVAGGGLSLAAVLGLLTQVAALPVALQWAMAAIAAAAAITACVVVGVRMTRRD